MKNTKYKKYKKRAQAAYRLRPLRLSINYVKVLRV